MTAVDRVPGAPDPNASKRDAATRERNLTRLQARLQVERARADFVGTLNALEDRINVPKRANARIRRFAKEQPVAAAVVAAVAVASAGLVVWLTVRNATKS